MRILLSDRVKARMNIYISPSTRPNRKTKSQNSPDLMDEADIQLRHEFNHAAAKTFTLPEEQTGDMATPPDATSPQGPLDALQEALTSGRFSDLTLICGEQTFKTHRVIVCSQSPVLASLCAASEFSGLINLSAHGRDAVTAMIEFLYTGTYHTTIGNSTSGPPTYSVQLHTHVYGLALTYQIPALAELAAVNFAVSLRRVRNLEVYFQSIRDVYALPAIEASRGTVPPLGPQSSSSGNGTHHPIDPLRAEILDAAVTELSKVLSSPAVLARFQHVCTEVPQFHADFLNALLETATTATVEVQDEDLGSDVEGGAVDGQGGRGIPPPPLCHSCGPRDEWYEIEVCCRSCGKECAYAFH